MHLLLFVREIFLEVWFLFGGNKCHLEFKDYQMVIHSPMSWFTYS